MSGRGLTFPLVSRRRLVGLAFGAMHGARRGTGSDVAGSRPYRPGDDPDRIDWAATARLSSARATDEFVVREHYADEAPRVVVAVDRRAALALRPSGMPWLDKEQAAATAADLIEESVAEARGFTGALEFAREPHVVSWCPPGNSGGSRTLVEHALPPADGPGERGAVGGVFEFLAYHRRSVPSASFVFVLSDYLAPPPLETWERALDRGWDIVPVVIQDPLWEQSFPDLDRIAVPLVGPDARQRVVRLRAGESELWRARHEERYGRLLAGLRSLGIEPVLVSHPDPEHVFDAFLSWSAERQASWSRGW